jgi:hypothetical protein
MYDLQMNISYSLLIYSLISVSTAQSILSPTGCLYLLLVKENRPEEIMSITAEKGFESMVD